MIKKILLGLTVLAFFSCETKETKTIDYVVFAGKIKNVAGGVFKVTSGETTYELEIDEQGAFKDTLNGVEKGYYLIGFNNETSPIYLEPGYDMTLSLNPKQFDESIEYTGLGATENNYLAKKFLNDEALGQLNSYKYLGTLEEADYIKTLDSVKTLQNNFLETQSLENQEFKKMEAAAIHYDWATKMERFELYHAYVNNNPDFKQSNSFPNIKNEVNLEDESLLGLRQYRNYLTNYYQNLASAMVEKDSVEHDIAFLKTVSKQVKSKKIKEHLLFNAAKYGISYTNSPEEYYTIFMDNTSNESYRNEVTEKYEKIKKLARGAKSPTFDDYENYAGGTASLADFSGKYVYIDVWATWCGPCLREIPSLKAIEKEYHNKNIEFISISIDKKKDYDKWRTMVEEKELGGVQLYAPNDWKSDFVVNYGILGIPRFILVDPEGNIVEANAPRPSAKELKELFNSLNI